MDKNLAGETPVISVIVPIYNVEKYVIRCLDSIFGQQFSGVVEVIAVDDHSTDNSLAILKNYKIHQPGLIIIEHSVNKALSCARASGIAQARGKYILHVDSDDWLLPGAFEGLTHMLDKSLADIVVFNYIRKNIEGKKTIPDQIKVQRITSNKLDVIKHFTGACWNKIVKRELLMDIIYGTTAVNSEEDLIYCTEILLKSNTVCLLPICYYVYFDNSASITAVVKPGVFLKNQHVVLKELDSVLAKYHAEKWFTDYILNYFEKWIYLSIAKIHFWDKAELKSTCIKMINDLRQVNSLYKTRINNIEATVQNKFSSINAVRQRFGLKMSLAIIARGFIK